VTMTAPSELQFSRSTPACDALRTRKPLIFGAVEAGRYNGGCMRTPLLLGILGLALSGLLVRLAPAQDYPAKPVHLVVPYVAGGAADIFGRTLAQKLGESLHQSFVVENKPGANGGIGADLVAKAAPDGYTLLATASGPIVVNPVLYASVPYDPLKDFAPVAQGSVYQYVLVTLAASPIRNLADLVAAARAKPGAISYGSTGIGGGNHLAGELLALSTGTQLTHVPYKGSAAALADLLGGQISFMFDTVITSVPQLRAGKLRAFAVSSAKRASALPDVPTLQEAGIAGFDISQWQGVLAPAATPRALVDRLNTAIRVALRSPDVRERLVTQGGNEIVTGTPADFAALIRSDLKQYAKLIKDARIPAQ
jgi:tripartite-type tricarboxylate transporter receptor subunit TctC